MKRLLALALAAALLVPLPALSACTNTPNLGLCKPAIGDTDWGTRWNTNADILDNPPKLVVSGAGPHTIGGATNPEIRLFLQGAFTGSAEAQGVAVGGTMTPAAGSNAYGLNLFPTLVEAASGTHSDFAAIFVQPPTITPGAAALTNASTLKITGAPTGAANNYALWVAAGRSIFAGGASFQAALATSTGPSIDGTAAALIFKSGTSHIQFNNQADSLERMRLTDGGILALGTTVTTGASPGELVLANNKVFRGLNNAGTTAIGLIHLDAADRVSLAPAGSDIRWGTAPVALGGGATPTFGTIGGSGPATAAQDSWMRVVDSGGATFWVPAWK